MKKEEEEKEEVEEDEGEEGDSKCPQCGEKKSEILNCVCEKTEVCRACIKKNDTMLCVEGQFCTYATGMYPVGAIFGGDYAGESFS